MNTALNASHDAVAGKKEKLMMDLKSVVADTDDLLQEVARSTADEFVAARTSIEGRLGAAKSRLDEARGAVVDKAKCAADAAHDYVRDNPSKVLGVAVAAGLVIGFLLSSRQR